MEVIDSFSGRNLFLSNFFMCPNGVMYDNIIYKTVEHAYQAAKSESVTDRLRIAAAGTPGKAKREGRALEMRPDFPLEKREVMLECLRSKFDRDKSLATQLIATEHAYLIEGNHWNDRYWGCVKDASGSWAGSNHLGELLMQVRKEVRAKLLGDDNV